MLESSVDGAYPNHLLFAGSGGFVRLLPTLMVPGIDGTGGGGHCRCRIAVSWGGRLQPFSMQEA
ncbi:MAG: hypothetical protein QS721_11175 [Candidatus Endonucleobacter sp. (ex Gigantidas childressi)]|nr:hypothetical protein [Candidatus Endonucleobacter sp. (ex Gigantidas childressi)]